MNQLSISAEKARKEREAELRDFIFSFLKLSAVGISLMAVFAFLLYIETPASTTLRTSLQSIFQLDSTQIWWYVTRSAGLTGYFLMWLSMVWGFAISSKIFHPAVDGSYSYDFHEHLSLLGLGFVAVHVIVLMLDNYLPFNLIQVLIPFTDTYRSLWVGMGIISLYLLLLVTVTFYTRKLIGSQAFRFIHVFSILGYFGATLHGLFAGTDSALSVTKILYAGTFLIVLFMTIYWVALNMLTKHEQRETAKQVAIQNALKRNQSRRYKSAH